MSDTMQRQLAALNKMTTGELVERYAELHGHPCRTRHRAYLIRKIAWRIQANAEGDLSERARKRAAELANDAEVRVMAPIACKIQTSGNPGEIRIGQVAYQNMHTMWKRGCERAPTPAGWTYTLASGGEYPLYTFTAAGAILK